MYIIWIYIYIYILVTLIIYIYWWHYRMYINYMEKSHQLSYIYVQHCTIKLVTFSTKQIWAGCHGSICRVPLGWFEGTANGWQKKTFGHRTKPKEILNSESRLVRDFSWRIDLWSKKPRTGSHGQQEIRWLPESLGKSKVHWVNCGWIRWSSSMQTSLFCVAGYWRHNHRVNSSCENLRVLPIEHLDTPVRADFEHLLTVSACLLWDWASYLENAHLVQKCCM